MDCFDLDGLMGLRLCDRLNVSSLHLILNVLDNTAQQISAVHLNFTRAEARLGFGFGAAKIFTRLRILQDAGFICIFQPPSGDGRNALLVIPQSNAVPGLLEKAKACANAIRATLHVNVDFTEVLAKKVLLDLFGAILGELPWKDTAPFLRLSVVEAITER